MTIGTVKNVSAHDVEVMLNCEVIGDALDMVSDIQAELEFEAMVRGDGGLAEIASNEERGG